MSNEERELLQAIDLYYDRMTKEAAASGYHLNPDTQFTKALIAGLIVNEKRYGYGSCPCRLAAENRDKDLDIICPCDYRDPDLAEHGACYCALFVSETILKGERELSYVPERRLPPQDRKKKGAMASLSRTGNPTYPVWRCKVCGYLCAREAPPETCPICKAKKERFEKFI
ncbi:MAG: ferredoxin:glutaredoxin reductase [Syntrophus sp. (in: bacteria)]|nr:ferredoxin:glutaredoxin reductase [Syntrophus sp. (in: bacteria)]